MCRLVDIKHVSSENDINTYESLKFNKYSRIEIQFVDMTRQESNESAKDFIHVFVTDSVSQIMQQVKHEFGIVDEFCLAWYVKFPLINIESVISVTVANIGC